MQTQMSQEKEKDLMSMYRETRPREFFGIKSNTNHLAWSLLVVPLSELSLAGRGPGCGGKPTLCPGNEGVPGSRVPCGNRHVLPEAGQVTRSLVAACGPCAGAHGRLSRAQAG